MKVSSDSTVTKDEERLRNKRKKLSVRRLPACLASGHDAPYRPSTLEACVPTVISVCSVISLHFVKDKIPMITYLSHIHVAATRRDFLLQAGNGFGALWFSYLLTREAKAQDKSLKIVNPLAPKRPHFAPKAKAVIFLYLVGGPSQMETFDPKPVLDKLHGQQLPPSFGEIKSQFVKAGTPLMGSAWKFKKYRQSGIEISELFPSLATCFDDIHM